MPVYFDPVLEIILFLLEFDDSDIRQPGLTNQQMQRIQIIDPSSIQSTERCTICMESFLEHSSLVLRQLECGHHYHEDCIFEWLQLHDTCPLCRYSLTNNSNFFSIIKLFLKF